MGALSAAALAAILFACAPALCAEAERGGPDAPFKMTVQLVVEGDPEVFDDTQRHAFLAAFAKIAKLGYQIGDLHWDPGRYDKSRGRAQIVAIHRRRE